MKQRAFRHHVRHHPTQTHTHTPSHAQKHFARSPTALNVSASASLSFPSSLSISAMSPAVRSSARVSYYPSRLSCCVSHAHTHTLALPCRWSVIIARPIVAPSGGKNHAVRQRRFSIYAKIIVSLCCEVTQNPDTPAEAKKHFDSC